MQAPSKTDYLKTYLTLYEGFKQGQKKSSHRGHPYDYEMNVLILFFIILMIRRITAFKAQHRWLKHLNDEIGQPGFEQIQDRTTLSRRFKGLYQTLQAFIAYQGQWAEFLSPDFDSQC